ncbi:MAG: hypothetical protein GC185_03210 [Alphaproteobacteria bacterium]|nr:hypothetical protein [Alphaproteobacteria bacterium]
MTGRRQLLSFLIVAFLALAMPAAHAQQQAEQTAPAAASASNDDDNAVIGTVMEVQGTAIIQDAQGGAGHTATVDGEVHMNDVVTTGAASHIFIQLIDDTEWSLDENSRFKVDEYVFDPDDGSQNKARYSVLQGAFNYVSGLVAHGRADPDVKIATPVGSIGIRGTDFWGGEIDGQYGVLVNEGKVDVQTQGGSTTVGKGLGTFISGPRGKPSAARAWSQKRLSKIRKLVELKRQPRIQKRIQKHHDRQMQMRRNFKRNMQRRRERQKMQGGKPGQRGEQRQEQRQNQRQERRQDGKFRQRNGGNDRRDWRENKLGQRRNEDRRDRRENRLEERKDDSRRDWRGENNNEGFGQRRKENRRNWQENRSERRMNQNRRDWRKDRAGKDGYGKDDREDEKDDRKDIQPQGKSRTEKPAGGNGGTRRAPLLRKKR